MTATRSTAKSFTKYQEHSDDTVTAHFADGSSVTGDVLVAADGANSAVRQQYLPHATVIDAGIIAIGGKVPVGGNDAELIEQWPGLLFDNTRDYINWGFWAASSSPLSRAPNRCSRRSPTTRPRWSPTGSPEWPTPWPRTAPAATTRCTSRWSAVDEEDRHCDYRASLPGSVERPVLDADALGISGP